MAYLALGPRLFEKFTFATFPKVVFYRILVFIVTYLTYIAYHIAKRPISVVENSGKFLDCNNENLNDTDPICQWSWVNEMSGVSKVNAASIDCVNIGRFCENTFAIINALR